MENSTYLPAADGAFDAWITNFSALISEDPTKYGLTSGDATAIADVRQAWHTAYVRATDPITRTPPTIASKDQQRRIAELAIRPYAIDIRNNQGVNDERRTELGLTVPKIVPTPIPPPASAPDLSFRMATPGVLKLGYRDTANPAGKAKPYGVIGVEIWTNVGDTHATDPSQCGYAQTVTKTPFNLHTGDENAGKKVTVYARFVTRSGPAGIAQKGPWSTRLALIAV